MRTYILYRELRKGIVLRNRIIESRFLSPCSQPLDYSPFFFCLFVFSFPDKGFTDSQGSFLLSNPLMSAHWQPIQGKETQVKMGPCPGQRQPAPEAQAAHRGLRKTNREDCHLFNPREAPCTPSFQAQGQRGEDYSLPQRPPHHRTEGLLKEVCSDPRRAHPLTLPPHVCPSHFAQPLSLP